MTVSYEEIEDLADRLREVSDELEGEFEDSAMAEAVHHQAKIAAARLDSIQQKVKEDNHPPERYEAGIERVEEQVEHIEGMVNNVN